MAIKRMVTNGGQTATIAGRAAEFLAINYSGAHATKRIARAFGISLSTAKLLRTGRRWTVARLDQAAAIFGEPFREVLWPGSTDEIRGELTQIRRWIEELARRGRDE